ncbi:MAG: F0F1 ATP synthase subunit delta, partial [Ectobacillus sp.]
MSNEAVEKRYASALFELAKEHGQLQEIEKEVRAVREVFEENEPFRKLLKSPKLTI